MPENETIRNTVCYMCAMGCNMKVHVNDGKVTGVEPGNEKAGVGCPRWKAQIDYVYHPDRLKFPLKRSGKRGEGKFERISWNEALDTTAENLQKIKDSYGPEQVAFWIAYTKEQRHYFQRLTHAFGSPNYCTESSSCATSAMLAAYLTYGVDHMFLPHGMKRDPRCKMVWGSSIQNSDPRFWKSYKEAKKDGVKLIVIDPRRTAIADMAEIHLQPRPGTDGALALAMINVIVSENLHDAEFIDKWTTGFEELKKLAAGYTLERAEQITGIPADKIRKAAIMYATEKPSGLVLSAHSTTSHSNGLQSQRAMILLPAVTGNIEAPSPVRTAHNINDITLYDRVKDMPPGVGSERFPIWTKWIREMQSNHLVEHIDSGKPYPLRALFSAGLDIQFFPNSNRFKNVLDKLDFIAVTEFFHTPGTAMADIVLPVASWWERSGLFFDYYNDRITLTEPVIEPLGECRSDWDIYYGLAERLGLGAEFWNGDFKQCVNYVMEPAGIDYEYLKRHSEGIPAPHLESTKTGFETPSGKIEIASSILSEHGIEPLPVYKEPAESPLSTPETAKKYPLVLTSGARVLVYVHSQFRNIERLRRHMPEPLADISPEDAADRGIKSGDMVSISSPRGSIKMKANVTDTIMQGVISIPHHWPGDANANVLVDDVNLDPISGFPPYKSQLCQIARIQ